MGKLLDALFGPGAPYVPPPDPMEGKMPVGPRKCIWCEGHGVKRNYLDRAGSYEKFHCKDCGGTGNEPREESKNAG